MKRYRKPDGSEFYLTRVVYLSYEDGFVILFDHNAELAEMAHTMECEDVFVQCDRVEASIGDPVIVNIGEKYLTAQITTASFMMDLIPLCREVFDFATAAQYAREGELVVRESTETVVHFEDDHLKVYCEETNGSSYYYPCTDAVFDTWMFV